MEVAVSAGEHPNKAVFVTLRDDGNGHAVKVYAVFPMQRPAVSSII
jgi:hypothetical protein